MRNNHGLTTLAKVVIGIAIFTGIGLLTLLSVGIYFLHSVTDSDNVSKLAATFMKIGNPLPKGFHYLCGYKVSDVPVVQIRDEDNKNLYTFSASRPLSKSQKTSEAAIIINDAAEGKMPNLLGHDALSKMEVRVHDTFPVAGETMHYILGHAQSRLSADKNTTNAFFGAAKSGTTGRVIILWIQKSNPLTRDTGTVELARVKTLTDTISSF